MRTRALVSRRPGDEPVDTEVELDETGLRDDELLIRIVASGICHSDVKAAAGSFYLTHPQGAHDHGALCLTAQSPVTKAAAWYSEPALDAPSSEKAITSVRRTCDHAADEQVLLTFTSCGQCASCAGGHPAYCASIVALNFRGARLDGSTAISLDGSAVASHFFGQSSHAQHAIVHARSAVKLPTASIAELRDAALLGCGVLTGACTILRALKPAVGSRIAIWGAGAVGLAAVMASKISGCASIIVIDIASSKLALAHDLGATSVIDGSTQDVLQRLATITGGAGLDYALDCVGSPAVLELAVQALGPAGALVTVGGAPRPDTTVALPMLDMLSKGLRYIGVHQGDAVPSRDVPFLYDLWRRGQLPVDRTATRYRFTDVSRAMADVRAGTTCKALLVFDPDAMSTQPDMPRPIVTPRLRIACVGGGLAGLAFALAAQRQGLYVQVYEQAAAFKEIGNGVGLGSNSSRLINTFLGLEQPFTYISAQLGARYFIYRQYATGAEIVGVPNPPVRALDRHHKVARAELLDILRDPLSPRQLHTGKKLVDVSRGSGGYTLSFADGTAVEADIVVGADGIRSVARGHVLALAEQPPPDEPVYSGQVAWRCVLPRDLVRSVGGEACEAFFFNDEMSGQTLRGPMRHFLTFPIGHGGQKLNVVAFITADRTDANESWTATGSIDELAAELEGWCEPVQSLISVMRAHHSDGRLMRQALFYRRPLPTWTDGRGFVLIGDASAATLPHQGQGTGQAVESAVALAILLRDARSMDDVPRRLAAFQALRKPRADRIVETSNEMGRVMSASADKADSVTPQDVQAMATRWSWIWQYHVDEEAEKLAAELAQS